MTDPARGEWFRLTTDDLAVIASRSPLVAS